MRRTRGVVSKSLILKLKPLEFLEDGTPLYPISGSQDDDGGTGGSDGGDEGGDENDEGTGEDGGDDSEKEKPKPKPKTPETPEQMKRRLNRENKLVRERAEAAERKLQEIADKDKPELEVAKRELGEYKATSEKQAAELENLRIENAFLKLDRSTYDWHDPDDVIEKIRKDVTIAEDGTVEGLGEAVKAIAKAKPYLLKTVQKQDPKKEKETEKKGPTGSSFNGPQGGGNADATRRAALESQYPQLASGTAIPKF